jgi:hypothetical protein
MVVRRLPWATMGVVLAGAVAGLVGCGPNTTGPGATYVDTLTAFTIYTGTMTNTFGVTNFLGSSELEVGDIDGTNPGVTERGIMTFIVNSFEGDSAESAVLRLDLCNVAGNPFALGNINLERVWPVGTPPGPSQNAPSAAVGYGPIATSPDTGFVYSTVTPGVEEDLADSAVYSQFRVRFSNADGNNNGVSDFVDFRALENGNCAGSATGQPILILTFKTP